MLHLKERMETFKSFCFRQEAQGLQRGVHWPKASDLLVLELVLDVGMPAS